MKDDLIRRGKIGNDIALYMAENAYLNDTALDVLKMIAKWVDEQPAVDAVQVVRCKDCRMAAMLRKMKGEVIADCMLRKFHTDDEDFIEVCGDDFCSNGVRREDDANLE